MFMDMQSRLRTRGPGKEHDVDAFIYQSLEENVEHAVSLLTAHGTWVLEDRAESVER